MERLAIESECVLPEEGSPGLLDLLVPVLFQRRLDGHDEAVAHQVEHGVADAVAVVTPAIDRQHLQQDGSSVTMLARLVVVAQEVEHWTMA